MTQKQLLLEHLKSAGFITTLDAIKMYNILRPAEIVRELRESHNIRTEMVECVNQYGKKVSYARYIYGGEKDERTE